ncbi:MAG: ABC transporter ATP-binding protein [Oscillospiraceae bacterium]|nr:ABC transporter ATP-binding protein [Oscillospiraceae bacterium]
MKEIFRYLKPYRKGLIMATAAIAVSTLCDLLLPTIMSEILNNGVYQMNFDYIAKCCAVMLVVAFVGMAAVLIGSKISCDVVAGFCADVRAVVFRKVNAMSFEEFGKLGTAALVTRATHDVQTVSWIASEMSGTIVTIPVLFFGGVILAMMKDVALSMTLLAFVPVILAVVIVIGKKIVPLWMKSDDYIDIQNGIMRERLRGIRVIRAFNAEDKEHERIAEATHVMAENIIKGNVAMGLITPLATFLLNLAAVLIVYFGGWRMESGSGLTGGDVFAIVQYVSLVSSGVIMGAFAIIMFPHAKVAADRIGQVLHAEGAADPIAWQDRTFSGEIEFDHVTFSYEGAAEPALRDISLHIQPGQKVSVIGGTGSGKSTLVSMLLGFRMPTEGRVLLDGTPTTQLSRHTMRENMSCVLQNATIYSGTIRENVRMGRQDASDEEILRALDIAQATEFVQGFADGIGHEIKQSGKNLSGGQKQRLSIARAVLKDAPIYIFDDSFSALDFLTEANLRRALAESIRGKTQIVITQRVTSAMHSDCIYVMDKGCLVDSGTHEQLLARCGVYQEIYASQTGGVTNETK